MERWSFALGLMLSPFMAALLFSLARVIVHRVDRFIPRQFRKVLFITW